jgi:hypothetical protein
LLKHRTLLKSVVIYTDDSKEKEHLLDNFNVLKSSGVTKDFLNAMCEKIKVEVEKEVKEKVKQKLKDNLDMLLNQGIITSQDAIEFAKQQDINITSARRTRVSISSGTCGGGGRTASC